jgi:hypothetical protein
MAFAAFGTTRRKLMGKKTQDKMVQVGRLAMRVEGEFWNAYLAKTDTMADAVLLGSMRLSVVEASPENRDLFSDLMRVAMSEFVFQTTGIRAEFRGGHAAPEHERAGRA